MTVNGACTRRRVPPDATVEARGFLASSANAPAAMRAAPDSPVVAWQADLGRGTLGVPAVGPGVGVITTVDRWVYTFDPRTGKTFWRSRGETPFSAGPVVDGQRVYAASEGWDGSVMALDLHTGKRRWRRHTGDVFAPLVLGDSLLFGTTHSTGITFALRTSDGAVAWRARTTGSRAGLALLGSHLAVVTLTDSLMVLDANDGTIVTRTDIGASSVAPPAVIDDSTIAITSPAGEVIAVTVPSGRVAWRVRTASPIFGAAAVAGNAVYVLTNRCTLWSIPVSDPTSASHRDLDCLTVATPLVFRDGVLVATVKGELLMFDRQTGERRWSRQLDAELRHAPVVSDDRLIVAPTIGPVVSYR